MAKMDQTDIQGAREDVEKLEPSYIESHGEECDTGRTLGKTD